MAKPLLGFEGVLPNSRVRKLICNVTREQGGGVWRAVERCRNREASTLMIYTIIEESFPPFFVPPHTPSHMSTQWSPLQRRQHPRGCFRSRHQTLAQSEALIFRFPAPKLWRNEFLFFINYPVCGIMLQQHTGIACCLSPSRFIHTTP